MSPSLQFIATVAAVFFSENLVLSQAMGAGELVVLAQRRSRIALTCLCMVLGIRAQGVMDMKMLC